MAKMKHYPPCFDERSGFYHLIYENYQNSENENDRMPNLERAKCIEWPSYIINNCVKTMTLCSDVLVWENERKTNRNVLLFCQKNDYLVVLGKRKDYFLLITAYPVQSHTKRKLLKEYIEYKNAKSAT